MLIRKQLDLGFEGAFAPFEARDLTTAPGNAAIRLELDGVVPGGGQGVGAGAELMGEHLGGGVTRSPSMDAVAAPVRGEAESVEPTDIVVLDQDAAVGTDLSQQLLLVSQSPHQHARASVDEAPCQSLVQRIRQRILDGSGAPLPMLGIL